MVSEDRIDGIFTGLGSMDGPIISPDGKWMWTGSDWIPAPPGSKVNQTVSTIKDTAIDGDVIQHTDNSVSNTHIEINTIRFDSDISTSYGTDVLKKAISNFTQKQIEFTKTGDLSGLIGLMTTEIEHLGKTSKKRFDFSTTEEVNNLQFLRLGQEFSINNLSTGKLDHWETSEGMGGLYQLVGYDVDSEWVFLQRTTYGFEWQTSHFEIKGMFGKTKPGSYRYKKLVRENNKAIYAVRVDEFCKLYLGSGTKKWFELEKISWEKRLILNG